MSEPTYYDSLRNELILRQAENCKGINFAPLRGYCYHCGKDLVTYYGEAYATKIITGCPLCNISYCE